MKRTVLLAVLAGTLGFVVFDSARVERSTPPSSTSSSDPHRVEGAAGSSPQAAAGGASVPLALPERSQLGKLSTQLFASRSWQPPARKISPAPHVPPAPTAPPMPYRYAGKLVQEGPQQVKLGMRFEVVLRVTSGQPLQASPVQLRFDPAYLEFVEAKPGKFLGGMGRDFSYRANPDGSIFVGASIQDPAPAAGAEL